jgi:predicted RNase H-like nuclease (RuvC/YqgF family)
MSALDDFKEAYERLKKNKPIICEKNTPINLANIAKEAGKTRSSLRKGRGFDEFIEKVQSEINSSDQGAKRTSNRKEKRIESLQETVERLKQENSLLKSQNLSLLMSNYAMERQLKKRDIKPQKVVEFTDFKEEFSDIDLNADF